MVLDSVLHKVILAIARTCARSKLSVVAVSLNLNDVL